MLDGIRLDHCTRLNGSCVGGFKVNASLRDKSPFSTIPVGTIVMAHLKKEDDEIGSGAFRRKDLEDYISLYTRGDDARVLSRP